MRKCLPLLAPLQADSVDPATLAGPPTETYQLERWIALDGYDPGDCPGLMERIERGDVWITPTLVVSGDGPAAKLARVEPVLADWREWMHRMLLPDTASLSAVTVERIGRLRALFSDLDASGARWLAGSDAPNPGSAPGIGLHRELEMLVDYGLTPLHALRVATLDASEFERRAESSGSLDVGKDADIVLLTANPLEDIRNTQQIQAVVLGGRVVASN